jgi:hypothetical protein
MTGMDEARLVIDCRYDRVSISRVNRFQRREGDVLDL